MKNDSQTNSKDIIYIDVEDDVTSIIGKVRASGEKIVALVPPKNIGALQSAVNLRLIQKAADSAGKRIVLITNNSGLTALAAGVKLPVAKNLQSKPEVPAAAPVTSDSDEDVINGEDLPVGELAAASGTGVTAPELAGATAIGSTAAKASDYDFTLDELPDLDAPATGTALAASPKGPRVPDFNRFRKWIFIGGGLLVALILFFVLGNVLFTGATVVITAQTADQPVNLSLTLTTTGPTDPDTNTIQAVSKSTKKSASVTFTPTGQQNEGNKATGSVNFTNSTTGSQTVAQGTTLTTSDGSEFTLDKAVTVPAGSVSCPTIFSCSGTAGKATGTVTAAAPGAKYNGESGNLDGAPNGISATLASATSGGTDNIVTVVTDADIAKAKSQLTTNSSDAASAKAQLTSQFGGSYVVIGDSFGTQTADPTSSPASGQAGTTAKLSADTTYTLTALAKSQIKILTTNYLNTQLSANQKVYDDGSNTATTSSYIASPSGVQSLHLITSGKVGPNIDERALKTQIVGKKSQEIVQQIMGIGGIKNVSVHFAPFWRSTAPSADKIKISFDLGNNGR
jgi:hypothetical protein